MNLLAKRGKEWLFAIIVTVTVWGCQEDLGIEVPPGQGRTEGVSVELNLPLSNVFLDSIRTDKAGQLLVGEYSDAMLGTVTTKSFFEYSFKTGLATKNTFWIERTIQDTPETTITVSDSIDDLVFESAILRFRVLNSISASANISQELVVHSLADSIYDDAIYLNNRSIETESEIGRATVQLDDVENLEFNIDTVVVSIDVTSQKMSDLFELITTEGFESSDRGLSISTGASDGIWSFLVNDDTTELELTIRGNVYDTTGTATIRTDTTFQTAFRISASKHFVNVSRDFTGTDLVGLANKEEFNEGDSEIHYFPLAGIYPVINLSPFLLFAETEDQFIATLGNFEVQTSLNLATIPQVPTTRIYFGKRNDGNINVNWPGSLSGLQVFSSALVSDNSYLGSSSANLYSMLNDTLSTAPITTGFQGTFTAFWQSLHQNIRNDLDGVLVEDRPFPTSALSDVNNFVMYPQAPLSLGQSTIESEGVKLKIFYTRILD